MALKPDINPRAFLNLDPLDHQEKHSPVLHVAPQLVVNTVEGVGEVEELVGGFTQREQHKAIFDVIEAGDHGRAAMWIAAGYMGVVAPSLMKTAKYGGSPGAALLKTDDEMVASEARKRAYLAWSGACPGAGVDRDAVIEIIVHGNSFTKVESDHRRGRHWARRQLVNGLVLFETLQRWNGRQAIKEAA